MNKRIIALSAMSMLSTIPAHASSIWVVCVEDASNSFSLPAAPTGYGVPAYLNGGTNLDSEYPYGYAWADATTGGVNHNFAGSEKSGVPFCVLPDSQETMYPRFYNGQFQMSISDADDNTPQLTTTIAAADDKGNNPTIVSNTMPAGYPANAIIPDTHWSAAFGPLIAGFWYNTENVTNFAQEMDMSFIIQMFYSDRAAAVANSEEIKAKCPPPYDIRVGHLARPNPNYKPDQVCE